jgi:hypothetical protein
MRRRLLNILAVVSMALLCLVLLSASLGDYWRHHPIAQWREGQVNHKVTLKGGIGYATWQEPTSEHVFADFPWGGGDLLWAHESTHAPKSDPSNPTSWAKVWLIPTWLLALAFGLLPAIHLARAANRYRLAQQSRRKGHCLVCNYDLTGNVSGTCPECGTKVPEKT